MSKTEQSWEKQTEVSGTIVPGVYLIHLISPGCCSHYISPHRLWMNNNRQEEARPGQWTHQSQRFILHIRKSPDHLEISEKVSAVNRVDEHNKQCLTRGGGDEAVVPLCFHSLIFISLVSKSQGQQLKTILWLTLMEINISRPLKKNVSISWVIYQRERLWEDRRTCLDCDLILRERPPQTHIFENGRQIQTPGMFLSKQEDPSFILQQINCVGGLFWGCLWKRDLAAWQWPVSCGFPSCCLLDLVND